MAKSDGVKWKKIGGGSIDEGQTVEGKFRSATRKKSDEGDGYYYSIEYVDGNGEVKVATASDVIGEKVEQIAKGQRFRITCHGKRKSKKNPKKSYNVYTVEVAD